MKAAEIGNGHAWDVKPEGWWKAECPDCGAWAGRLCGSPVGDHSWAVKAQVCQGRKNA